MSGPVENPYGLKPVRVVLLDNRPFMRTYLESCFLEPDFALQARATEAEAAEALSGRSSGALLIPESRSTPETWEWARGLCEREAGIALVLLADQQNEGVMDHALLHGADLVLPMPAKAEELRRQVMSLALRKRTAVEYAHGLAPDREETRLRDTLHTVTEAALHGDDFCHALLCLAEGLAEISPDAVVAVLAMDHLHRWHRALYAREPVPLAFVKGVNDWLEQHRRTLMGVHDLGPETLFDDVRERSHVQILPREGIAEPQLSVEPVMTRTRVMGFVAVARPTNLPPPPTQPRFMREAASHLASLLTTLTHMRELIISDPLIGCYNRRHLESELPRLCREARQSGAGIGLFMLDIDFFKEINDSRGHACGDAVLREFHGVLRANALPGMQIFRPGGDEFLLLAPGMTRTAAGEFAERLLAAIRTHEFHFDRLLLRITSSCGAAVASPGDPAADEQLLDDADRALYASKRSGRDQFTLWGSESAASGPDGILQGRRIPQTASNMRVLVVDDDPLMQDVAARVLRANGHEVMTVGSVDEAELVLRTGREAFALMFTDLSMPDRDGFEMLGIAEEVDPLMIRALFTGHVTAENAITAIRKGAFDFIEKPFTAQQLLALTHRALEYRRLLVENHEYQNYLELMVRKRNEELAAKLDELRDAYEFSLDSMVAMLDAWEEETSQHSRRVMELTGLVAGRLGIQEPELSQMLRGAMLHDIGKIGVPTRVLRKPGALTPEEWALMRRHPEIGYGFIRNWSFLGVAADIVRCHHEAFDGSGYPRGLKGADIPLGARIFSLIDAYDAMRSPRVYKAAMSMEEAGARILEGAGHQFDPSIVSVFLEILPEIEEAGRWNALRLPDTPRNPDNRSVLAPD